MDFNDENIQSMLNAYYRGKALDSGLDYLSNHRDNRLRHQDLELSIVQRKRSLGLPVSSDEYNEAANEPQSFFSLMAPSMTKRALSSIPGTVPKSQPFFKVATAVEDLLPSIGKSSKYGASKYGSISRFLSRAASL